MNSYKRYIFCSILILFLFIAPSADAAVLSLDPSSSTVLLGQEFNVRVNIDTQGEFVTSTDVFLAYDRSLLDVVSVTSGSSSQASFFPDFFQSVLDIGQIYMGGIVTSPTDNRIGQGVIGTVRFKAKDHGTASVTFLCEPGQTNDTNISRDDKNATDIVDCSALMSVYYVVDEYPVSLQYVQIYAPQKTATTGQKSFGISALAYDQNNMPIWDGVTYEWGISSSNSIGSVDPTAGNITNFTPLNAGTGDVFVVARMSDQSQASGVLMTVTQEKPGDVDGDGFVRLNDLSTLLSFFGKTGILSNGDINGDGQINLEDLVIVLSNFGK